MTTNSDPYQIPLAFDTDDSGAPFLETTLTASKVSGLNIGAGLTANCEVYNGNIPGPVFKVNLGDSLVVRLKNQISRGTGIHWHGVEMANKKDGTPFTQNPRTFGQTYLYKLRFPRPGLYWYHPHHEDSTNQAFRGLYGAIVVTDTNLENALIAANKIPSDTQILILSDITVCKQLVPSANDLVTFPNPNTLPWVGGTTLPAQPLGMTPVQLCETGPLDVEGDPGGPQFGNHEVPNIQQHSQGATAEGQTVLTNGMNAGPRGGSPTNPTMPVQPMPPGTVTRKVTAGQGLRLQIFNTATIRYFRLILTQDDQLNNQTKINIYRIGGEGGLLNQAVLEGGTTQNGFDTKYKTGEILLPSGTRADCVVNIPNLAPGTKLTMWTQDYQRTGQPPNWANLPTVPVMHLEVIGNSPGPAFSLDENTVLRTGNTANDPLVEVLSNPTGSTLDPAGFGKDGMSSPDMNLTVPLPPNFVPPFGIDGITGTHHQTIPYTDAAKELSARYVTLGDIVQLTVKNLSKAHHPFHLHGFSMQPKSLTDHTSLPNFLWPYDEFRDTIDIPPGYKLTFLVKIDGQRPHVDDQTLGGSMGRWLFHCHIFFHAHLGMMSELIVTDGNGIEKPYVDVNGSWAYAMSGNSATRTGVYAHPDNLPVTLSASDGQITDNLDGTWSWSWNGPNGIHYVYINATDGTRTDQAVFRVQFGGNDTGADNGDPHIHTVDGKRYDFQAAGEFTLLRDVEEGMEIQTRQTPVLAANPVTDAYDGLRTCVSVNTAVAALVGRHSISYQPSGETKRLLFYFDRQPFEVPREGVNAGPHRVTKYQVQGASDDEVRIDYANGTVVIFTPLFWDSYGVHYFNVSVAHTPAEDGIMGRIPKNTWLPLLPGGGSVGPMTADLDDRFVTLYKTFADAWRVTKKTSLFTYEPETSTETFTDRNWPAEKPPCKLQPRFEVPGAHPPRRGMSVQRAANVCSRVTVEGLRQDCIFDVATTGDQQFAVGYELMQKLRRSATAIQVLADQPSSRPGEVVVTGTVSNLYRDANEVPHGEVIFFVDGKEAGTGKLDERGRASMVLRDLALGEHTIRAEYAGAGGSGHQTSSSPNLVVVVRPPSHVVHLRTLVHLEGIGDVLHADGEFAGTRGQSRRLEGFEITFRPPVPGLGMRYMAHLQSIADTGWVTHGQFIGTRGQSRRLEGFAIELTGPAASAYDVTYFAHLEGIGDTPPVQNGQFCGTRGQSRRVEGISVSVKHR